MMFFSCNFHHMTRRTIHVGPTFVCDRYTYGGSEYTSSGPGTGGYTNYNHQAMTNYELSADYVDSTTTYDPRPTQTQVADTVAPDTPSVTATGVLPSVVTTGKSNFIQFYPNDFQPTN